MAIKLGQLGCKLSLSDINMEGLKKTVALCVDAGIKAENLNIFTCDVSKISSI